MQSWLPNHRDPWQAKGGKNFYRVRLAHSVRQIVIAHQNHHWHTRIRQLPDTDSKFALPGGIRVTVLVDVPGKDRQMHPMVEGIVYGTVHGARKVKQTTVQSRGRIQPTVIFYAKVHVR